MRTERELERFCAEAYPRLVAALAHHFGDRWLAEEFAQDALIRACDRWERVRRLDSPVGWAFRVGANLAKSYFRRRAAARRARRRHGRSDLPAEGRGGDVVDRLVVDEALQSLTEKQRRAVVLRFYLGLSGPQAAEVMGSTAGAVRALTHRAVGRLRETLDVELTIEESADAP